MKEREPRAKKTFDTGDYPALREFLPAYLHQDFGEFYNSAAEAVKAFLAEASGDEIYDVKREWSVFRNAFTGRPIWEIQKALVEFDCAWMPQSEMELRAVDEILSGAQA